MYSLDKSVSPYPPYDNQSSSIDRGVCGSRESDGITLPESVVFSMCSYDYGDIVAKGLLTIF